MKLTPWTCVLAGALVAAGAAVAQDAEHGKPYYDQYCATCHGAAGLGDGPLAEMILNKVPDLTGLSAANDGKFPMLDVIHVIDGRKEVRGHGVPMPIYGGLFAAETHSADPDAQMINSLGKILSIAYYLESLQK